MIDKFSEILAHLITIENMLLTIGNIDEKSVIEDINRNRKGIERALKGEER